MDTVKKIVGISLLMIQMLGVRAGDGLPIDDISDGISALPRAEQGAMHISVPVSRSSSYKGFVQPPQLHSSAPSSSADRQALHVHMSSLSLSASPLRAQASLSSISKQSKSKPSKHSSATANEKNEQMVGEFLEQLAKEKREQIPIFLAKYFTPGQMCIVLPYIAKFAIRKPDKTFRILTPRENLAIAATYYNLGLSATGNDQNGLKKHTHNTSKKREVFADQLNQTQLIEPKNLCVLQKYAKTGVVPNEDPEEKREDI
jgi:hypothetical protein